MSRKMTTQLTQKKKSEIHINEKFFSTQYKCVFICK